MKQLLVIAGALSGIGLAKPYQLNCTAKNQPVGKNWLISATLMGTVDRGISSATLENIEGDLEIHQKGIKSPWSETDLHQRSLKSDDYYLPVKYKNHYRFELHFDKNPSFHAEKVDFLLPKLFEAERANRAYFILNHVNDSFGGTIALRCNIKDSETAE